MRERNWLNVLLITTLAAQMSACENVTTAQPPPEGTKTRSTEVVPPPSSTIEATAPVSIQPMVQETPVAGATLTPESVSPAVWAPPTLEQMAVTGYGGELSPDVAVYEFDKVIATGLARVGIENTAAVIVSCTKKPIIEVPAESTHPATTETATQENRWGTYKIENANIGIIEEVSIVDGDQGLDSGFNQILLDAGKREINHIFQDENAYNNYQIDVQVIQMEGSQDTAEWPIIVAHDLRTGKVYRWSVWALTPGGYSLRIPSEKDLRDNAQVLVPLAEITTLGSPGGGSGTGPDVIGPVVGDGVQATFRFVQNSGWYFIPPFPDLSDQVAPIKSGGF